VIMSSVKSCEEMGICTYLFTLFVRRACGSQAVEAPCHKLECRGCEARLGH
jgi:hypothetical protein